MGCPREHIGVAGAGGRSLTVAVLAAPVRQGFVETALPQQPLPESL